MIADNAAQLAAFSDPLCIACNNSYTAGMISCPTCHAPFQHATISASETRAAVQESVTQARAETNLVWKKDFSLRGGHRKGSQTENARKARNAIRARGGMPAWQSVMHRFQEDAAFKEAITRDHADPLAWVDTLACIAATTRPFRLV